MPKLSEVNINKATQYKDIQNSRYGIYCYRYKDSGKILYVGKDSHIDIHRRHLDHIAPSKKTEQLIHKLLHKQQDEIEYAVLCICEDETEMINLECMYILFFKSLGMCEFNISIDMTHSNLEEIKNNISNIKLIVNSKD